MERGAMSSKRAQGRILAWAYAFLLTSSASATAQTFSWNWTGPYLGADAGYVSSRSSTSYLVTVPPSSPYLNTSQALLFNQAAPDTISARGIIGTLHAGWNWQLKPFAVGIELDAGAFRTRATRDTCLLQPQGPLVVSACPGLPFVFAPLHTETSTDWLLTGRVRSGWVYSTGFLYLTGGLAVTRLRAATSYVDTVTLGNPTGFSSFTELKMGWTIGGGVEFAIAPRWTVRAEYLRVEFPSGSTTGQITNPINGFFNPTTFSADLKADIVRAGFSYKFEWLPTHELPPASESVVVTTKN
jgi:outer membrane immunogenic protein